MCREVGVDGVLLPSRSCSEGREEGVVLHAGMNPRDLVVDDVDAFKDFAVLAAANLSDHLVIFLVPGESNHIEGQDPKRSRDGDGKCMHFTSSRQCALRPCCF
jgi:hypothetical protein